MIRPDLSGSYLSIISHARPSNVQKMTALVGEATWFVGVGEAPAYQAAGAAAVIESGQLCHSRNVGIDAAQAAGGACVQLSDDLTKLQVAVQGPGKLIAQTATFDECVRRILEGMAGVGARLGGAAPTANPFYANIKRPVHSGAFIVGDFIVVGKDCDLRFNEHMTLKEDYDYTLQHVMRYGVVARRDDVLATFQHRSNPGGAVAVRTAELEQENIAILRATWGGFIADNPRRPNEILLKLPRAPR